MPPLREGAERRSIETAKVFTAWYVWLSGVVLFTTALVWGSIEFWRHGTIHALSGLLIFALIFIGLSLFAGLDRVSGALRAVALAIREARGKT